MALFIFVRGHQTPSPQQYLSFTSPNQFSKNFEVNQKLGRLIGFAHLEQIPLKVRAAQESFPLALALGLKDLLKPPPNQPPMKESDSVKSYCKGF